MMQSTARREAEEFARVIDGPTSTDVAARFEELTRAVTLLREHPRPAPRPEFVRDLRAQLMAAAETDLVPATPIAVRPVAARKAHRRLATVAAATVFVGGTAGMAAAAQGTLPGDSLYPVKRGLENIALQLNTSDAARGRDLLGQATTRLHEAQELLAKPDTAGRDALVDDALADATANANSGADLLFTSYQRSHSDSDIADVRQFASTQVDTLKALASDGLDGGGQLGQIGDALAAIDQQARVLCSACSGLPAVTVPTDIISLSSVRTSLMNLVTVPTARASQLEKLAAKAQHTAKQGGSTPETTTDTTTTTTPAHSTPKATTETTTKDAKPQPAHDLLKGVTDGVKTGLPGQVGTTINGVTSGLTGLVDGTLGLVGGLLGGTQK
jgi:hypothetical protein